MIKPKIVYLFILLNTMLSFELTNAQDTPKPEISFYGFVRLVGTYDFQDFGGSDLFKPSAISVPLEDPRNSQFFMSAKQSRIGMNIMRDTEFGPIKAVLEADFHDTSDRILGLFRLRHAYVKWEGLTIGQTWSTFYDIQARPHIVDFEGANSSTLNRAPLIRYDFVTGDGTFSIAVENPTEQISITGDAEVENLNIPDIIGAYKLHWKDKKNFVKIAALVRQLRFAPTEDEKDSELGWGVMMSGKINMFKKDNLKFQVVGGDGIARYIEGVRGLGYDGIFNEDTNELETLGIYGGFLSYQHHWNDKWNSSIVIGTTRLENNSILAGDEFSIGDYASANIFYKLAPWMFFGLEYLHGRRENVNGEDARGNRIQFGTTLRF